MGIGESLFRLFHGSKLKALEGIPGPEPTWPLGNVGLLSGSESWEVFGGLGKEYGPMALFWILGSPLVVLNDPDLIEDVLLTNRAAYYKDSPVPALTPVGGADFVFFAEGEDHARKRAAHPLVRSDVADAWYPRALPALRAFLRDRIDGLVEQSAGGPLAMLDATRRLTYGAFGLLAVGDPLDERFDDFMTQAAKGNARVTNPLQLKMPLGGDFKAARERWRGALRAQVEAYRANPDPERTDLLAAFGDKAAKIPVDALGMTLGNLHYGGGFSTNATLIDALYELTRAPEAEARLRKEVCALSDDYTYEELSALPFLDSVIRETTRLWCPVPLYGRNVLTTKPTTLGGRELPANTELMITNWGIQRDGDRWERPTVWDPERWTDEVKANNPYGSAQLFPFGRGPRECLGREFALFYVRAALATILRRTEFECGAGQEYEPDFFFAVLSPGNLTGTFKRRTATSS